MNAGGIFRHCILAYIYLGRKLQRESLRPSKLSSWMSRVAITGSMILYSE